ncbi:MAG: aminotransferase class V-fold PLP-dependent enzyme [Firmicutes bacterium]|nr:aminotransferase class V-fold PLP-dependent enzyme [Bacillota bacterium]
MTVYDQERPLFLSALLDYCEQGVLPMHTPGHKQGGRMHQIFAEALRNWGVKLDIDPPVLWGPEGEVLPSCLLLRAREKAASLFGAKRTFFLTNGTTAGIQAMFLAAAKDGRVVIPRQTHGSVLGALILSGADPVILPPEGTSTDLPDSRLPQDQLQSVLESGSISAVFSQNPSYYGFASDLAPMVKAAHQAGVPVLVDEAHGPHFTFSRDLPPSALEQGADLVAQSTHKLLTSLTGSSMLHLSGDLISEEEVARFVELVQSTSPSFLLLASLEATVYQYQAIGGEITSQVLELAQDLRKRLQPIPGLRVLGESEVRELGYEYWDPTKVVLDCSGTGLTGLEVAELLRKEYLIQVEMADFARILLILGPGDDVSSISRLELALEDLVARNHRKGEVPRVPLPRGGGEMALTPREAYFSPMEVVAPTQAVGRISAGIVAPYPPGIPVVIPGEVISEEQIEYVVRLSTFGFRITGADSGIRVVRE